MQRLRAARHMQRGERTRRDRHRTRRSRLAFRLHCSLINAARRELRLNPPSRIAADHLGDSSRIFDDSPENRNGSKA